MQCTLPQCSPNIAKGQFSILVLTILQQCLGGYCSAGERLAMKSRSPSSLGRAVKSAFDAVEDVDAMLGN